MNKRTYLESLNAGRRRRQYATLEQLNRSLDSLEQRIDRNREETQGTRAALQRSTAMPTWDEPRQPRAAYRPEPEPRRPSYRPEPEPRAAERYAPPRQQRAAEPPRQAAPSYQGIMRDIERLRGQEDGVQAVAKIAGEIKALRDDLRQQMASSLHREFDTLRQDIEQAMAAETTSATGKLGVEFERLSGAIEQLAGRNDDRGINLMRLEIEEMKHALDSLAREETVRSVDRRWEEFDRRFDDFEHRLSADMREGRADPAMEALVGRVDQIAAALAALPDSLSLRSLDDKVHTLQDALEHFVERQGGRADETLGQIEERLDEISRAIVATTVAAQSAQFDPEPLRRIEARIASLAEQIEEVSEDRPGARVMEQLDALAGRVDDIAVRAALPQQAIERLAGQVAAIAERIERMPDAPDAEEIFSGIDQRFDVLSGMIERRQEDVAEQGMMLFRELERRLDEVAVKFDRRQADAVLEADGILGAIDARFTALADKLDGQRAEPLADSVVRGLETRLQEISDRLDTERGDGAADAAIRGMETRLQDISQRLEDSMAQFSGMDRQVVGKLEAQVAALSAHLHSPGTPLPDFEDIGPRLDEIERAIADSRGNVLEAARQAAEDAARMLVSSGGGDQVAVAGLAQDLKALETLTRRADERNGKTFEAIHDTLLKIVDRLGSLESETAAAVAVATGGLPGERRALADAPSIDPEAAYHAEPAPRHPVRTSVERSPAQAAAAAAVAAMDEEQASADKPRGMRSMLGGLTRKLGARKEAAEPVISEAEQVEGDAIADVPQVSLDAPLDPQAANRPLEPGSGAPDLNAIMKRVRDERGQPARPGEGDAAKSDFIAAARRAAQAAAAEAEALKRKSDLSGPVKALRIGDLLKARRKPILMAAGAIMIALAGLQLGKAFMDDGVATASLGAVPFQDEGKKEGVASAEAGPVADEPPTGTVALDTTVEEEPAPLAPAMPSTPVRSVDPRPATPTLPVAAAPAMAEPEEEGPDLIVAALPENPGPEASVLPPVPDDIGPAPLREAAASGDAKALFEVASRYAEGRGTKADMAEAARWYERSADLGFAPAQFRIGSFYEKGLGVARDIAKARSFYEQSAAKGNASAMHNLAVLYAMGADGTGDNEAAARWFSKAAELGVKDSQFNLGILAAKGVGMPQDLEQSYKWFALVAKAGDKDAADKRDEIATSLRPEQLERARATAELWKPKPLDEEANSVELPESWQVGTDQTASIDMEKAIRNIQLILGKNGYDAGKPDGLMGGRTKNAIAAFQRDNGMPATGEIDETLVQALLSRK